MASEESLSNKKALADTFDSIVRARRSVRIYDQDAPFDASAVTRSLERAVLAPNSSNMQLWEFYRIRSDEEKAVLAKLCMGQKAASTARELIVIVARRDKWRERAKFMMSHIKKGFEGKNIGKNEQRAIDYYGKLIPQFYYNDFLRFWPFIKKITAFFVGLRRPMYREVGYHDVRIVAHKSAALAAQTFMLSMKAEGYDSCPMEGIDSKRIKRFLNLPKKAEINMVIGVGPGKSEGVYGPRVRVNNKEVIFDI